jgi:hypothetical protein
VKEIGAHLSLYIAKKRSRLTSERAADLVFLFSSLRLREKFFDLEYKEQFVEWIDEDRAKYDDLSLRSYIFKILRE